MKLLGPAWRKDKKNDMNWEIFYQIKKWITLNINHLIRTTLHAESTTGNGL